jgi:superfamily II DNA or RNA helicase
MITLRPYQDKAVADLEQADGRPLFVAPTGSGKNVIASEVIKRAENKHVIFLAHRRELIKQTATHLAEFGIYGGIILAGEPRSNMRRVQVNVTLRLWWPSDNR